MAKTSGKTLESFAEDLGTVLGKAESKARGWLQQRKDIAKQLTAVRDKADELLRELTGGAARMAAVVNEARTRSAKGSATAPGTAKRGRKRPMSAAERKAVSARMKKYWAERKAAGGRKTAKKAAKAAGNVAGNG